MRRQVAERSRAGEEEEEQREGTVSLTEDPSNGRVTSSWTSTGRIDAV